MFEIAGILALLAVACAILVALSIFGLILKLAFKIVLIPLALVGWLLKGLLLLLALVACLVLAPVGLAVLGVLLAVAIPVLVVVGIVSLFGLIGASLGWMFA